jgi:hypothetical protein
MIARTTVAMLAAAALGALAGDASADGAPPRPAPTTAAADVRGAVVVAVGDDAAAAARPLALALYRDPALRPSIDDATARVLAGEPVPGNLPADRTARLRELASLRISLAQPSAPPPSADDPNAPAASSDVVSRRLLSGIGAETRAKLVVTVTLRDDRPVARALRVSTASFEGVEIGATMQTAADGTKSYLWPGAAETLRGLLPTSGHDGRAAAATGTAAKPAARTGTGPSPFATPGSGDRGKSGSFWSSPWFWVALGGVVATGVTVFVVANEVQDDGGVVHLRGKVAP